jgi:predicted amidohydrolase YtcJ
MAIPSRGGEYHREIDMNSARSVAALLAAVLLAACSEGTKDNHGEPALLADTIYTNGEIITLDPDAPRAQALAIIDGTIIRVGNSGSMDGLRGDHTEVVDLEGRVVLPGFHDLHVHPVFAGIQASECSIPQGSTLPEIQQIVKACADEAGPGIWITGGQWDTSAIGHIPHRRSLDEVAPDNPVLLGDTSEHSFWANSMAFELAGVTRDTPDPPGGFLERDADGIPSGVLREEAVMLVRQYAPEPSDKEVRKALEWGLNRMMSYGITSFSEASAGYSSNIKKEMEAFAFLADSGVLKQRARICIPWIAQNEQAETIIANRAFYARDRVSPDCVKIFLDGVPTDGHTAAMLEPYADSLGGASENAGEYGMLMVKQNVLNDAVTRFDGMGLTVKFHSAGDAAVRAGLDAIEAARVANGPNDRRHNVGHCTFVAGEDMPRADALGASFEVSPYLWSPSPINDSITAAIGAERIKRVWPVREIIESGALVVPGSDWSVVPSVNPWIAVEALVTREEPGGSARHFGKEQAITLDQAIRMFTVNAARHTGMENSLGRIKAGMLADLIVLDRNPWKIPSAQLHQVRVVKTLVNGEVIFDG